MDIVKEIKRDLRDYTGEYESFIGDTPFLAKSLLACDKGIKYTPHITSALAFLIMPNEVLSFDIYGPYGYIPFIFVAVKAIQWDKSEDDFFDIDEVSLESYLSEVENKCLEILNEDEINKIYHILGWE